MVVMGWVVETSMEWMDYGARRSFKLARSQPGAVQRLTTAAPAGATASDSWGAWGAWGPGLGAPHLLV